MDWRIILSVTTNVYNILTLCQVIRHIFQACLLVRSVESQSAILAAVNTTPPLEHFKNLSEIDANATVYMRYCDTEKPIYDEDSFFDRVVAIVAHPANNMGFGTGQIVAPGVFIDTKRVLTSYSPFRNLRHKVKRSQMYINYCTAKAYNSSGKLVGYYHDREQMACARQVSPMEDKEIVEVQWHGTDRTHTPLHDLMILKTGKKVKLVNATWYTIRKNNVLHFGPLITKVAGVDDQFPDTFRFVSLGFIDNPHIYNKNHLHTSREYDLDDKVREDCDEWFPRDWGYFFCIKNNDDYVGIGSGAFLVGNEKVYGVGSFALKKGKESILVFTDVRPYTDAMNMTCNKYDGN